MVNSESHGWECSLPKTFFSPVDDEGEVLSTLDDPSEPLETSTPEVVVHRSMLPVVYRSWVDAARQLHSLAVAAFGRLASRFGLQVLPLVTDHNCCVVAIRNGPAPPCFTRFRKNYQNKVLAVYAI